MNKNKVILSGKVGQDARIINLPDGAQVVRFILATSEVVKGRNGNISVETQWHNVVAWNNNGIEDLKSIVGGVELELEGKLRYIKYTSADGTSRSLAEIVATQILLVK